MGNRLHQFSFCIKCKQEKHTIIEDKNGPICDECRHKLKLPIPGQIDQDFCPTCQTYYVPDTKSKAFHNHPTNDKPGDTVIIGEKPKPELFEVPKNELTPQQAQLKKKIAQLEAEKAALEAQQK